MALQAGRWSLAMVVAIGTEQTYGRIWQRWVEREGGEDREPAPRSRRIEGSVPSCSSLDPRVLRLPHQSERHLRTRRTADARPFPIGLR